MESCIESAGSIQALTECGKTEIDPLEAKAEHLFAELLPKAARDPGIQTTLYESKRLWNAYRHNQCFLEGGLAMSANGEITLASERIFFACVKRTLQQRVQELELARSL
jgi:uncharacterized protein YecT (DUF1311 family)